MREITKLPPKIKDFIYHPAVKNAWICNELYGFKDSTKTSVFANKKTGKIAWELWEVERLQEIRKAFLKELK